jgi:hypothetical protein
MAGLTQMAKHSAFAKAPYELIFDAEGDGDEGKGEGGTSA